MAKPKVSIFSVARPDTPAQKISDGLKKLFEDSGGDVSLVDLNATKLNACDGCYAGGGRSCINPCDYNDVESSIYDPKDQGQLVFERLLNTDIFVVIGEARKGSLDCVTQKFMERLIIFSNIKEKEHKSLLDGKAAIGVAIGDSAQRVAGCLLFNLNTLGFMVPGSGVLALEVPPGIHMSKIAEANNTPFDGFDQAVSRAIQLFNAINGSPQ